MLVRSEDGHGDKCQHQHGLTCVAPQPSARWISAHPGRPGLLGRAAMPNRRGRRTRPGGFLLHDNDQTACSSSDTRFVICGVRRFSGRVGYAQQEVAMSLRKSPAAMRRLSAIVK